MVILINVYSGKWHRREASEGGRGITSLKSWLNVCTHLHMNAFKPHEEEYVMLDKENEK